VDDEDVTRDAIHQFYSAAMGILATASFPKVDDLMHTQSEFPMSAVDDAYDWSPVTDCALIEEEEHNIKLVYVVRELAQRYGSTWKDFHRAAEAFTLTPNVGPAKVVFEAK